jgi:hypothetical protein
VAAVAAATGRTPAQVVLAWAAQLGVVPLPRSTNAARIAENWAACPRAPLGSCAGGRLRLNSAAATLAPEHMAALAALDTGVAADGAPARAPAGRLMKGSHLAPPGQSWEDLWDVDFDADLLRGDAEGGGGGQQRVVYGEPRDLAFAQLRAAAGLAPPPA